MQSTPRLEDMVNVLMATLSPASLPRDVAWVCVRVMHKLAGGEPVTSEQLRTLWPATSEPPDDIAATLANVGMAELDDDGNITATIISITPTRHRFMLGNRTLYTWCAIDTLFMPAVLRQHADIESTCPITGKTVRLDVGPDAIETVSPPDAYVSLVAPGITTSIGASCNVSTASLLGVDGGFCSRSSFFASRVAADEWLSQNPGALVLPVDEAFAVAKRIWADPFVAAAAVTA